MQVQALVCRCFPTLFRQPGRYLSLLSDSVGGNLPPGLTVVRGDITTRAVDAIVNAANTALVRGGGVCGAIFAAAGPELDDACRASGGCATGDALATPGFRLAARWIIHTVGPVWHGGDRDEPRLLASCYRRCLAVADELGVESMAFPAISTGIFGYPVEDAAVIAVEAVHSTPTRVRSVEFVCFDEATERAFARALARGSD